MKSAKLNLDRVMARAQAQLEGIKSRPELERALGVPADDLAATVARVHESQSRAASLKKAWQAATRVTRDTVHELSRKLEVNLVMGELKFGMKSDEVTALGANILLQPPRKRRSGPGADFSSGSPTAAATAIDPGSAQSA